MGREMMMILETTMLCCVVLGIKSRDGVQGVSGLPGGRREGGIH